MKKKLIGFLGLLYLVCFSPVYAGLGEFKDDFEKEEQERRENDVKPEAPTDLITAFIKVFFVILETNSKVCFSEHPYATVEDGTKQFNLYPKADDPETYPKDAKDYWYAIELKAGWLDGLGYLAGASLKGRFWRLIGPRIEYGAVFDDSDFLATIRLGLEFPVFQADVFTLDWFVAWERWLGILDRSGLCLGLEFRSFPIDPLLIEGSYAIQIFEFATVHELDLRLGLVIDAWQISLGWRLWTGTGGVYHGPILAIAYYL